MAQAPDGSVLVVAKFDSSGIKAGVADASKAYNDLAIKAHKLSDDINSTFAGANMAPQPDATQEYAAITAQIEKAEKDLNRAIEKKEKFLATGGDTSSKTYAGIEYEIESITRVLEEAREEKRELEKSGKINISGQNELDSIAQSAEVANEKVVKLVRELEELKARQKVLESAGVTEGYAEYDANAKRIAEISEQLRQYSGQAKTATARTAGFKRQLSSVSRSAKKAKGSTGNLIKTLLKYTLGIRSLFVLFNRLRSAVKEGMNNLVQFDGTVNNSMSSVMSGFTRLKNATATAFAPLLNVAAPIIRDISDRLSELATSIGMFFAALTGQKEFTRAVAVQEDYAESLEKTAEAAQYLSGLDEIKTYSNSPIGAGGVSTTDMFETVEIPSIFEKAAEEARRIIDQIKKDAQDMFQPLKNAWNEYGGTAKNALVSIGSKIKEVTSDLYTSTANWAKNLNWEPAISSASRLLEKIDPLVSLISDGLLWAYNNVLLPFGTWTIEDAVPAVLDTIGNALQLISEVGAAAAPTLQSIWDNFFAPAASFVAEAFVDTVTAIGDFLGIIIDDEDAVQMLADLAIAIGAVVAATKLWEAAQLALNVALDANPIGVVIGLLALLIPLLIEVDKHWDEIYSGFVDFDEWLTGQLTHDWTDTFGILGGGAIALSNIIYGVYVIIRDVLGGLAEFLDGVFSGNWEKIWHGLGTVVSGVFKGILLVIVGVINAVVWAINLLWEGIYSVIKGIVDGIGGIAGALGSLFGQDWSFSMPSDVPKIPYIPTDWADIPWLAKGAVIPPNAPFAAVLGEQRHGTNIEAPLATIEDAVERVFARHENNNEKNNTYHFTAQIGRRTLFDEIITEAKLRQSATGRNPFALS